MYTFGGQTGGGIIKPGAAIRTSTVFFVLHISNINRCAQDEVSDYMAEHSRKITKMAACWKT